MTDVTAPHREQTAGGTPPQDAILIERAERDLEEGVERKSQVLRADHPLLGRAVDAGVNGALSAIGLRERYRDDVRLLLSLAHRVAAGEDPEVLARDNLTRIVRVKEMSLVVREKDPAFPEILDRARAFMAKRLPDLARMVSVPDPVDYEDIVRRAFPDRTTVETMVAENRAFVTGLIDHVVAHPHLLRVPSSWLPRLDRVSRDLIEWQTQRVQQGVAEIYAPRPGGTSAEHVA